MEIEYIAKHEVIYFYVKRCKMGYNYDGEAPHFHRQILEKFMLELPGENGTVMRGHNSTWRRWKKWKK